MDFVSGEQITKRKTLRAGPKSVARTLRQKINPRTGRRSHVFSVCLQCWTHGGNCHTGCFTVHCRHSETWPSANPWSLKRRNTTEKSIRKFGDPTSHESLSATMGGERIPPRKSTCSHASALFLLVNLRIFRCFQPGSFSPLIFCLFAVSYRGKS